MPSTPVRDTGRAWFRSPSGISQAALFGLAYWALAEAGRQLTPRSDSFVALWLPSGLFLGVLLLNPVRRWPWLVASAGAANLVFDLSQSRSLPVSLLLSLVNGLEAVGGAWLFRSRVAAQPRLGGLREVVGLIGWAALLATLPSAFIGAGLLQGLAHSERFWQTALLWWASDAVGIVVMTPVLLSWAAQPLSLRSPAPPRRWIEAVLLALGLALTAWWIVPAEQAPRHHLDHLLLPFLAWAGLRFGMRGAASTALLLALLCAVFPVHSPFASLPPEPPSPVTAMTLRQFFVGVAALMGLIPAAVLAEQSEAQRTSRESDRRFRELLDRVHLLGVMLDREGKVTYANEHLLRLTGWTAGEIVGQDWFQRFVPPDVPLSRYFHELLDSNSMAGDYENPILLRSGQRRVVRWSNVLLRDANGHATGTASLGEDITDRREAERLLREQQEHFRSLIENSSDVIIVLTPDGRILADSPAITRILGYPAGTIVGQSLLAYVHPEDEGQAIEALGRIQANPGPTTEIVLRIRHRDGSWRSLEAAGRPLPPDPRSGQRGLVVNARDITDRQHLEAQLIHAQKMQAVGQLAGGVAHDFNNILAAIITHLHLMRQAPDLPAEMREGLDELAHEARRAEDLTRQLLMISRRQVLHLQPLDLGDLIDHQLRTLRRLAGPAVSIVHHRSPVPAVIEADPGTLERVILNLAVNARDAMPQGGRLTLTTEVRLVDAAHTQRNPEARPGRFACLTIADTGCGMNETVLARIFEPFFTTKETGKGTGLGLPAAHGIVQQHRGWIEVQSAPGHGATFQVFLPATDASPVRQPGPPTPSSPSPSPSPSPTPPGGETILLVEDEAVLRRALTAFLKSQGYRVLPAAHGHEALQLWHDHRERIRLVISDLVMPEGLGGLELARQLRVEDPSLPLILTSGYTGGDQDFDPDPRLDGVLYLPKPCDPHTLARTIRERLECASSR